MYFYFKRFFLIFSLVFLNFIFFSVAVAASKVIKPDKSNTDRLSTAAQGGYSVADGNASIFSKLGFIVNTILTFVGLIFISWILYAGYLWMTAQGNQDNVDKALKIIRAAIVGTIITSASFVIYNFLFS